MTTDKNFPDEKAATRESEPAEEPPSYSEGPVNELPPDFSTQFKNLNLKRTRAKKPTEDQCIAHLKLLEAFYQLRHDVANTDGLFDIFEVTDSSSKDSDAENHIQAREKRWAIYVTRAVDRFEKWFDIIPASLKGRPSCMLTCGEYEWSKDLHETPLQAAPLLGLTSDQLPPIDVLMVWHAYLLNPKCFLEDCIRFGKWDFYATGLPLDLIDPVIDTVTFEYKPSDRAQDNFVKSTGLCWDNFSDSSSKALKCPQCEQLLSVPYNRNATPVYGSKNLGYKTRSTEYRGIGFAEKDFRTTCTEESCKLYLTHQRLRAWKFYKDVEKLTDLDIPLPGTLLGSKGLDKHGARLVLPGCFFPNLLVKALQKEGKFPKYKRFYGADMDMIKETVEEGLKKRETLAAARDVSIPAARLTSDDRKGIRIMMSRYWYNSSPFALDLVGAVIRQGTFIEKMHNIDWLHSPALPSTMSRVILRYERFFKILSKYPKKIAVPTLDIDLAWHTHQLYPQSYLSYSLETANRLVDHDDKIDEGKLSDGFAHTSKAYQSMFSEPYSECTCWYCCTIRESHSSSLDRVFQRSSIAATERLYAAEHAETEFNPLKSPHISAHNVVKDRSGKAAAQAAVLAAKLDKDYQKACAKARKKGQKEPQRDEFFYAYAWGYPMPMPIYLPYTVDPSVSGGDGVYAVDPCVVDTTPGTYGACAAHTCGGTASTGGCGGGCAGGVESSGGDGGGGCGGGDGGGGGGCGG